MSLRSAHQSPAAANGAAIRAGLPPWERPITIWVTFSNRANATASAGKSCRRSAYGPRRRGFRRASSRRPLRLRDVVSSDCEPGRSTVTAIQGASIRSASRLAVRTTPGDTESGPMQARMRSPAAHGPSIACACIRSTSVGVDPLGGAAQRQFAQRGQILRLEKASPPRARRCPGHRPCPRPAASAIRRAENRPARSRRRGRTPCRARSRAPGPW